MAFSAAIRRLQNKWVRGAGWPKRLEWIEIYGIRGWVGQRIDFKFPIIAIVGENGSGKSTILQSAASVYRSPDDDGKDKYASDYFPDTPFEKITAATIRFSFREGEQTQIKTVRKPTVRWRGNPDRPFRRVEYIDLRRTQPVGARSGYAKLLKAGVLEGKHAAFEPDKLARLSQIIGKNYVSAGMSVTNVDMNSHVPVVQVGDIRYSGFHQGAGEIAAAELLASGYRNTSLVLIDEVETSLHPRAQRRLIRDLARIAGEHDLQIILTTHSPYVLEELPAEARIYLMDGIAGRNAVLGVSPDFAMTRMDEEQHPECDVYVEDPRAATMVSEILAETERDLLSRVRLIPYGAASVGTALGQMAHGNRFPRPSVVFLDGDQANSLGCHLLPGEDAPEQVIFNGLQAVDWPDIAVRVGRGPAETIDALNRSMVLANHHEWIEAAADRLIVGSDALWQALCASWALNCSTVQDREAVVQFVRDALEGIDDRRQMGSL